MSSEFSGDLGIYREVITEDGSLTMWCDHFQEHLHSRCGARSETIYNYVEGCEIIRFCQLPGIILEVGLGIGTGVQETFAFLDGGDAQGVHYITLELDVKLLNWCQMNRSLTFRNFPSIGDLSPLAVNIFSAQMGSNRLTVVLGDARKSLAQFWLKDGPELGIITSSSRINAIYHDPFSPKRNPSLWSVDWFAFLRSLAHPDCILSTYSAAIGVRKALLAAKWQINDRPGHGTKRSSTVARLSGTTSSNLLKKLAKSAIPPLAD